MFQFGSLSRKKNENSLGDVLGCFVISDDSPSAAINHGGMLLDKRSKGVMPVTIEKQAD